MMAAAFLTYVGEMDADGKWHGWGVLTVRDSRGCVLSTYKGEWVKGHKHGFGVERLFKPITANGDEEGGAASVECNRVSTYVGDWKDSVQSGYGLCIYHPADSVYEGQWLDGKKDGKGIYQFGGANGSSYKGEWRADQKYGSGVFRWPDDTDGDDGGDNYDGEGNYFVGHWVHDKAHGKGVFRSNYLGYRFEGDLENGLRTKGVIRWRNGDSWEGVYYPDRSSKGVLTRANGEVVVGEWTDYSMKTMKSSSCSS